MADAPTPWVVASGNWLPCEDTLSAGDTRYGGGGLIFGANSGCKRSIIGLAELGFQSALWPLPFDLHGQGTIVWQADDSHVYGTSDSHGGGLLYYGQVALSDGGELVVIGNRAAMVAAALGSSGQPQIDPRELLWPLSRMGAPLGAETSYVGVSLLPQAGRLQVSKSVIHVDGTPPIIGQRHETEVLAADLLRRPLALDAYPDHPVEVMISGGKDIRLVLAALRGAGRLHRISRAVIWAPEGDPDLIVGRQLSEHLGFPLEVLASPVEVGPWQEGFLRHAFLGEGMVHAWDRKGAASVRDVITLNGYFGELYKSHVKRSFVFGPMAWRYFYGRRAWFDRHGLLTPLAREHLRTRFARWLVARESESHPWDLLNDRWHREARMQRWVGHILQAEACATPWLQLLPSAQLLERYVGGPLRERTQHRLHFDLLRRLAPDLLELPLAEDRWARQLDRAWSAPAAQPRVGGSPCAQAAAWTAHGREMAAWLRDGRRDGMMEWVDAAALEVLLKRCLATVPSRLDLVGLMGLLGVRAAFSEPVPRPMRLVAG